MKKVLLIILMFLLLIITLDKLIFINRREEKVLINTNKNENRFISMMLENEVGEYIESNDLKFPSEGYQFNPYKSNCENGSTLSWDEKTNQIQLKTTKSDKCYIYFDRINPLDYIRKTSTSDTLSKDLIANLYRYQGVALESDINEEYKVVNDNYLCINERGCNSQADENMYRIIGITEEGYIKVIKNQSIGRFKWHQNDSEDVIWPESIIFKALNTNIDSYLNKLGNFKSKIIPTTWYYGDIMSVGADGIVNTGLNLYQKEIGKIPVTHYVKKDEEWQSEEYFISSKIDNIYIGIMYLSDYYLTLSNTIECRYTDCNMSWIHMNNNGETIESNSYERVINTIGPNMAYNYRYDTWGIAPDNGGRVFARTFVDNAYVRPVFYISNKVLIKGQGTIENPYIVS